ncbi:MAG TPA: type I-C CRISPR-associated protein Cas5c [Kofleriaceae bacterium]|nr:type I-C CRISPR-associated protein Cas5c [Kofleriaceae bacterium]
MKKSRSFRVLVSGPIAVFTRPEMKVERVSYEVMTPSAARGVLEAVLWKPAIRWSIEEIRVLREVRWISFRRNEVTSKMPRHVKADYFADEDRDRAQRNTVALRDVAYVVQAHFALTERAGPDEAIVKFEEMFARRLDKGQSFHQPYLGCRELAADVRKAEDDMRPIALTKPLGLMFYDFDFRQDPPRPLFFEARLDRGVLRVPSFSDVLRENQGGGA